MKETFIQKILCVISLVLVTVFFAPFTVSAYNTDKNDSLTENRILTKNYETGDVTVEEYDYSYTRSTNIGSEIEPGVFVIPQHQADSIDSEIVVQSNAIDDIPTDSVDGHDLYS